MLQEVTATVTTPPKDTPTLQLLSKPAKKGLGVMARAVGAAVVCSALTGCPGPQVRPVPPPPEPCPVGAAEAMAKHGLDIGRKQIVVLADGWARVIPVKEGPTQVVLARDWGNLRSNTVLSGRLLMGDRVYGRITWATPSKGDSFPVCMEILSEEGDRGMAREPGDDSPSSARIFSTGQVRAVREFK
jgi:hypothetical protein